MCIIYQRSVNNNVFSEEEEKNRFCIIIKNKWDDNHNGDERKNL